LSFVRRGSQKYDKVNDHVQRSRKEPVSHLEIHHEQCDLCELCVQSCGFDAMEVAEERLRVGEECVLCGACVKVCPHLALEIMEGEQAAEPMDVDSYSGVWVFAEPAPRAETGMHPVALELLGKGRALADARGTELCVVVAGDEVDRQVDTLRRYPVDRIRAVCKPSLSTFCSGPWAAILADMIRESKPEIVLCGATSAGRSFFPRVAALVGTGLTADCTGLRIDEEKGLLLQTRPAFGGNIMATIVCPRHRPQMATVRPNVLEAMSPGEPRDVPVIEFEPDAGVLESPVEVLASHVVETGAENISEADIIVAGGRGVGGPEGFSVIRELAQSLDGAVGASRAAVDAGWIPYAHQVGQTGTTVQPRIYVACGISGAIQHLVGMQSADTIIAINKDPGAPIFEKADFGLVGDLHAIIPRLIEAIGK
jgi:electron transfer flavoprotein alpha subunit